MLALHQELSRDISGWFDFTGLFILLVELFNSFLGGHHLQEKEKGDRRRYREGEEGSREMIVDDRNRKVCIKGRNDWT